MRGSVIIAMPEATIRSTDGMTTTALGVTPVKCRSLRLGIGEVGSGFAINAQTEGTKANILTTPEL